MKRAATLAAAVALTAACGDTGAYPYRARSFDAARGCLGNVVALEVIAGADPGLGCSARCLIQAALGDGGTAAAFGGTSCGPVPTSLDSSETDPRCPAVKRALGRSDICLADGGQTAPADAATDAAFAD